MLMCAGSAACTNWQTIKRIGRLEELERWKPRRVSVLPRKVLQLGRKAFE